MFISITPSWSLVSKLWWFSQFRRVTDHAKRPIIPNDAAAKLSSCIFLQTQHNTRWSSLKVIRCSTPLIHTVWCISTFPESSLISLLVCFHFVASIDRWILRHNSNLSSSTSLVFLFRLCFSSTLSLDLRQRNFLICFLATIQLRHLDRFLCVDSKLSLSLLLIVSLLCVFYFQRFLYQRFFWLLLWFRTFLVFAVFLLKTREAPQIVGPRSPMCWTIFSRQTHCKSIAYFRPFATAVCTTW